MKQTQPDGLRITLASVPSRPERPVRNYFFHVLLTAAGSCGALWSFLEVFQPPVLREWLIPAQCLFCLVLPLLFQLKKRMVPLFILLACFSLLILPAHVPFVEGFVETLNSVTGKYMDITRLTFLVFRANTASGLEPPVCTTIFWLFLSFLLTLSLAAAAARRHGTMPAFLLTVPFPACSLVVHIPPPPAAACLLFICWFSLFLLGSTRGKRSRARESAFWAPVSVLCCLLLVGGLLFPENAYLRSPLAEQTRKSWEARVAALSSKAALASPMHRTQVDLGHEGFRSLTGNAVLRVEESARAPLYLHGFSAGVYQDNRWTLPPEQEYALEQLSHYPLNMTGEFLEQAGEDVPRQDLRIRIQNLSMDRGIFFTPYGLVTRPDELDHALAVQDAMIRSTDPLGAEAYTLRAYQVDPSSLLTGYVPEDAPASFREAQERYEAYVREQYLQIPENLKASLSAACAKWNIPDASSGREEDVIHGVEQFLKGFGRYTLEPGPAPSGEDFTEYFLFTSREGYCVHYATAAVLLLRAQGIPARYAEGFIVPESDFDDQGVAVVTDRRAHAWAEIYRPGFGWQVLDATPGYSPEQEMAQEIPAPESSPSGSPAPEKEPVPVSSAPEQEAPMPVKDSFPPSEWLNAYLSNPNHVSGRETHYVSWLILLIAMILVRIIEFRRSVILQRRIKRFFLPDRNRSAAFIYEYLEKTAPYAGPPSEALIGLVLKARFSQSSLSSVEITVLRDGAEYAAFQCRHLPLLKRLKLKYWDCLI